MLFGTRYLKKKMIILVIFMYFTSFLYKNKIITGPLDFLNLLESFLKRIAIDLN